MVNKWQRVPVSEVLKPISRPEPVDPGKIYSILGMRWYAQGLFVKEVKPGHQIKATELFRVERGDFVYNRLFAWKGSFGIVDDSTAGGYVSGEFPCFQVVQTKANNEFIRLYLSQEAIWDLIERISSGQTNISRLRLKVPDFLRLEIPLPSLEEQRHIVALIEALAARVDEVKRLRKEAVEEVENLFAAQLKKLRHRLRNGEYPIRKMGEIATVASGGTPSRDNLSYWGGNIPWIKTGELLDGDIFRSEESITQEGLENSSAKLFPPGTILVALYGQGQTRGRTGRLMIEAATNQACCAILPSPAFLEPRFTQYWQRSLYYEMREKSHGGAQPNWNSGMIKGIKIALPTLIEQQRIVADIDIFQNQVISLRRLQTETQKEMDAIIPSILDKAFKGKL